MKYKVAACSTGLLQLPETELKCRIAHIMSAAIEDLPHKPSLGDPSFQRMFAALFAAGVSITSIAQRTGVPLEQLNRLISVPSVDQLIKQAITESNTTETAERMIRGSVVDSVLTIVKLRDHGATDRVRFDAAKFLIGLNFGSPKNGLTKSEEDLLTSEIRRGATPEEAVTSDLDRLIQGDAFVKAQFAFKQRSTTPEPDRRDSLMGFKAPAT